MSDNPFEGWVTVQQAAEAVGRDHKIVGYWADKGYIRAYKVGHRTRLVNLEEVKAYALAHPPREEESQN
jgi:excisionase family DNA binding protein